MTRSWTRLTGSVLALLIGAGVTTSVAAAGPRAPAPAGSAITQAWGYVVSRHKKDVTYAPAAKDQGNSSGGTNTLTWTEKGHYEVAMPGLGNAAGAVTLSPLGSVARRCVLRAWAADTTTEIIDIACFTAAGNPVDSMFIVTFLVMSGGNTGTPPYRIGYLWADQPTSSGYIPARTYNSTVSTANPNATERVLVGLYRPVMHALGSTGGNAQVVAVSETAATCQPEWYDIGGDAVIFVGCHGTGVPRANRQHELVYTDKVGLKGPGAGPVAYLLVENPGGATYAAPAARRFSSAGKAPRIVRTGKGSVVVTLKGMPVGGAAVVSAIESEVGMCSIGSIRSSGLPQRIGVRCFDASGAPKDMAFSLSYLR